MFFAPFSEFTKDRRGFKYHSKGNCHHSKEGSLAIEEDVGQLGDGSNRKWRRSFVVDMHIFALLQSRVWM